MNRLLAIFVFAAFATQSYCQSDLLSREIKVDIIAFNDLEPYLGLEDDTVRILNFWATWCIPCVKELPVFMDAHENFRGKPVEIKLISLDFPAHLESRVVPFIKARNILPEVILLDDPDGNRWIPKVDPNWSGAIPATLVFNKHGRFFKEGMMDTKELNKYIYNLLH